MSVEVQATPTPREGRRGRSSRRDAAPRRPTSRSRAIDAVVIIALLGLVGVVLPVVVASHYGAMGIPRSDDWSYLLTLFRWVDSGELSFNGWVSMTLVGQIAIAAPIAALADRSITTIQLFTSMIGLVGLGGVVFIGRQTVRPVWWAVFVAVTIAVGPLWGPLAPTFMTDVPTFTFEMLTLAAAAVAFRRRPISLPWFAVSLALGFVGVSIRQYAVIPVIAIVLVAVCMLVIARDWRTLRIVVAISAVFAVAALAILAWWSGLPDSKSLSPTFPTPHLISATAIKDAGFLRLAGLLLFPVVVLAGPVKIVRRAWQASDAVTTLLTSLMAVWLVGTYFRVPSTPFLGNYVARDGVLSDVVLAGTRPDVIPRSVFNVLVGFGSIAGMLIVLAAVPCIVGLTRQLRSRTMPSFTDPLVAVMGLTITGFAIAYSFAIATGLPVYDRYALPILPLIGLLVLRTRRHEVPAEHPARSHYAWAGVTLVLLGILGLAFTADSASFDASRWKVAEMVTKNGYEPIQVNGGFEWLGWHREQGPMYGLEFARVHGVAAKLPYAPPCVSVVIDLVDPKEPPLASVTSSSIFRDDVQISAYRNKRPCVASKDQPKAP